MAPARGHDLQLAGISHRFGSVLAVDSIEITVQGGELLALLGPSGCGKSTLLRIIAGFIQQTAGSVLFDGQAVDHLSPRDRGVGIVFQNYALFPHMTVAQNIAYGLQARRWKRTEIAPRVRDMLGLVRMTEFADRKPRQLSGGQQQRVALARCLATDPKVLLLDEPFGALDKNLRLDMQIEVKRLQEQSGVTTVLVTHDQEEALSMADRIAVMSHGRVEQIASPTEIYDSPRTLFVNEFVGASNVLHGRFETDRGSARVAIAEQVRVEVAATPGFVDDTPVMLSIRPEQLRFGPPEGLAGVIKTVMPLGPSVVYEVEIRPGVSVKVSHSRQEVGSLRQRGERVYLWPKSLDAWRIYQAPSKGRAA